ncbi:MAG: TonB-dependent receptor [Pseudomonadota bacterium]
MFKVTTVAFAIVLASAAVWAQDVETTDTDDEARLGTIIVQGTKFEQSLQDVTASVAVVTAEEIAREPIIDLYDIVDRIPNVNGALGQQGFVIRGIDQRGAGGSSLTVTVFVDDSPLGNQTTFFGPLDSWDLGQVEVFRGPQSTNFGRNSIAGAIYLRTRDPSFERDARGRLEAGTNGILQVSGAYGDTLVDDVLAFRVSASHRESDGFIDNTFLGEDADATEQTTGRFKLLFEPTDNISIISTTSYTEHSAGEDVVVPNNGDPSQILDASDVSRTVAYNIPGREGTETFIQSVNAAWEISERWDLTSITTYQESDYFRLEDFATDPNLPDDNPEIALDRTGDDEVFTQEFRLGYQGDRLKGVLGAYYLQSESGFDDTFSLTGAILNPALDFVIITRDGASREEVTNTAVFFDGEYELSDSLDLLFGLRYDREDQDDNALGDTFIANPEQVPAFLQAQFAPFLGVVNPITEAEYEAVLPKLGLRWRTNENVTLAFVAQRAYRAGGSDVNFISGGVIDYDPEYINNYEFSARTNFLDGRLNWNTNVFYSDYTDQQVTESFPPPLQNFGFTVNAGESELYGFETDITYAATPELEIYGGFGYSYTEFIEFSDTAFRESNGASGTDFSGNRFPYAPRYSANAGISYAAPLGWFGGLDANYQSDQYANNINEPVDFAGERIVVNGRLGYRFSDAVTLTALAKNLLDEDYFVFVNRGNPAGQTARLGDEQTLAIRLDVDF